MRFRPSRTRVVGVVAVVLLAVAGCSSSDGGSPPNPAPTPTAAATSASASTSVSATVTVKNFAFNPATVTIPVGGTVMWKFADSAQHTATAVDKSFNSPPLSNGQTFLHTFTKAGTYHYFCSIHQFMTGTVIVR